MKPEVDFISYEHAAKLDVVYGIITTVEEVPRSEKLLKLSVEFGPEYGTKTILSAIKTEVEDKEKLVGKGAFFILNFPPRKIMGIVSEGMICPFSTANHPFLIGKGVGGELPAGLKLF
jgi:tRNA-binding protein